jgi:putative oxidoreductase
MSLARETHAPASRAASHAAVSVVRRANSAFSAIPRSLIAFVGRFSIAAVFWKSGQTKVEGLAIDMIDGRFTLGWPHFADSTLDLFRDEYKLPFLPPETAAVMATTAEHVFPVLLLFGLATRLSATALLVMTLVIEIFVYPDAWPLHGVWATVLLYLMANGPGVLAVDHLLAKRFR